MSFTRMPVPRVKMVSIVLNKGILIGGDQMDIREFEDFLHKHIPITKAMGFRVLEFTCSNVKMSAELAQNINHNSTAFGGSINSLMTICGWALAFKNIKQIAPEAHVVIQKSNISYFKPIDEDFTAECILMDEESRVKFIKTYERHEKSRIGLKVYCFKKDNLLAEFEGYYAAFK